MEQRQRRHEGYLLAEFADGARGNCIVGGGKHHWVSELIDRVPSQGLGDVAVGRIYAVVKTTSMSRIIISKRSSYSNQVTVIAAPVASTSSSGDSMSRSKLVHQSVPGESAQREP
ncbi:hypothetical protein AB0P21_10875 [Kribbella sp. NPDC056861]|uniref:hypothetical protein n=1 Tax=Kribbella sp. NPDC056861 TaxID=3154857 RepID=UPI00342755A0